MILVTGGTGLVGSHLLYQLTQKHEQIVATKRVNSDLNRVKKVFSYYTSEVEQLFNKIIWIEADVTDVLALAKAFENITHVYHTAAFISFRPKDYRKMRAINIAGTSNVVNCCIDFNIKKLCYVGSIASIDELPNKKLIDETNEWNTEITSSGYAITKYGSEMEVWRASQEGIPIVIVNPGVILGPGFWNDGSGSLFKKVFKKLKFYTEGVTGFVSVHDVVNPMISLMESEIQNERYILISENWSYKKLFNSMAKALRVAAPKRNASKLSVEILWRLESFRTAIFGGSPLITKPAAKSIFKKCYYNNSKIKNAIGFEFEPVEKSITESANLFLEEFSH